MHARRAGSWIGFEQTESPHSPHARSPGKPGGDAEGLVQPGHTLVTTGIYGVIRHPSYLGALVFALGWGLAFRSSVGVLLAALLIPLLLARIRSEEALLRAQFGAEYDAYCARTSRLIPGVF
jgi:protein-S-isoprenylcysteine O-methyltransferase Ste14